LTRFFYASSTACLSIPPKRPVTAALQTQLMKLAAKESKIRLTNSPSLLINLIKNDENGSFLPQ